MRSTSTNFGSELQLAHVFLSCAFGVVVAENESFCSISKQVLNFIKWAYLNF